MQNARFAAGSLATAVAGWPNAVVLRATWGGRVVHEQPLKSVNQKTPADLATALAAV